MSDTSGPTGTWYLNARSSRLTLSITTDQSGSLSGTLTTDKNITDVLDDISWDPSSRTLEFRRNAQHFFEWYRGILVEGVLVGRFSHSRRSERPSQPTSFTTHVTGWNREYLDGDIVPRVYEVTIMKDLHGRLRIDRGADGSWLGRLKVYRGPHGEEPEYDLEVTNYSAGGVRFIRHTERGPEEYEGFTQGRTIAGTLRQSWTTRIARWNGYRAEVLTYGLTPKSASDRALWQDRTRQQLYHLMMAGNPRTMCTEVVVGPVKQPFRGQLKADRDDDPQNHPQNYQLVELHFRSTVPNPYSTGVIQRKAHGYLAIPTEVPPRGGFPIVLALNGHSGSAYQVMNPGGGSTGYWYGDAFARRGFVVLALDIGHRSDSPLYDDDHSTSGDDPDHGNGPHPSIKPPRMGSSDWEEDGERAWDVMRALDFLLGETANVTFDGSIHVPPVSRECIVVTGLSMGGEIATIVGALEPRVAVSIPTGFSPDMGVMLAVGNHPCWRWVNADIREYLDASDYHALTAPRPLLVETGKRDPTYSHFKPPFAADKQVARRSRVSYGDESSRFVHYLHYDAHHYHVGDKDARPRPPKRFELSVRVPDITEPQAPFSLSWQTDPTTHIDPTSMSSSPTIFDYIRCAKGRGG